MTVIEFGRKGKPISSFTLLLSAVLFVSIGAGIFVYNYLIALRHDVADRNEAFSRVQVKNAELKTLLYEITDGALKASFLESSGLIQEKNPSYLKIPVMVSDNRQ